MEHFLDRSRKLDVVSDSSREYCGTRGSKPDRIPLPDGQYTKERVTDERWSNSVKAASTQSICAQVWRGPWRYIPSRESSHEPAEPPASHVDVASVHVGRVPGLRPRGPPVRPSFQDMSGARAQQCFVTYSARFMGLTGEVSRCGTAWGAYQARTAAAGASSHMHWGVPNERSIPARLRAAGWDDRREF